MNVTEARWVKSSYSGPEQGNCVEVAPDFVSTHGVLPVRDSKNPEGPNLSFMPEAFVDFVSAVKRGEFGI